MNIPLNSTPDHQRGHKKEFAEALPAFELCQLIRNIPEVAEVRVTLDGNPERGLIIHLAHHHLNRSGSDHEDLIDGGQRNVAILRELARCNIQRCFLEGHAANATPEQIAGEAAPLSPEFLDAFADRVLPEDPSDRQAQLLSGHLDPLSSIIHYFYPWISLYGSEPASDVRTEHYLKGSDSFHEMYRLREVAALDAIQARFDQLERSQRRCALIYGSYHVFSEACYSPERASDSLPVVSKTIFQKWSILDRTQEILNAPDDAQRMALIEKTPLISHFAFALTGTPELQLAMLPKLKITPDFYATAEDAYREMQNAVKEGPGRSRLEECLDAAFADRTGPFSYMTIRPGAAAIVESVRGRDGSLAVWSELHQYTQNQIIDAASTLAPFCFCRIIGPKSQMQALPKISPSEFANYTKDILLKELLGAGITDNFRA